MSAQDPVAAYKAGIAEMEKWLAGEPSQLDHEPVLIPDPDTPPMTPAEAQQATRRAGSSSSPEHAEAVERVYALANSLGWYIIHNEAGVDCLPDSLLEDHRYDPLLLVRDGWADPLPFTWMFPDVEAFLADEATDQPSDTTPPAGEPPLRSPPNAE